jgi:PAS domain S-box-containing protein
LKEREKEYRSIFDNSVVAVFRSLPVGRLISANFACAQLMGYGSAEELVNSMIDLKRQLYAYPDRRDEVIRKILCSKGGAATCEEYLLKKDGTAFLAQIIFWAILDERGNPKYFEGFISDITEKKKAEEVLRRDKDTFEKLVNERTRELLTTQGELERAKRLSDIGTLAATVAHELRNPLGVIRTAVYNLRRKNQNGLLLSHLANIEKKVLESDQIINNLLFYSRIKMPNYERINVRSLLEECLVNTRNRFQKWDVTVSAAFEALRDEYLEADTLQISELFNNVLNNAYESFNEKKGKISIAAGKDDKGNCRISFRDNGPGIDPEDLERLPEPFFTRKSKGTGLGLTVCYQIVNLHSGEIGIYSEKGKGTTVIVSLPVKRKTL